MAHSVDRPLWRTQLCRHGPHHPNRFCRYAHSLLELLPPDEAERSYCDKWSGGQIDRFYGQLMTREQLSRILFYFQLLPACDVPVWAIGLSLLERELEHCQGYALPWDFGLLRDHDDLLARRLLREGPLPVPFEYYPRLWERLTYRRRCMLCYSYPRHELGARSLSNPPFPGWRLVSEGVTAMPSSDFDGDQDDQGGYMQTGGVAGITYQVDETAGQDSGCYSEPFVSFASLRQGCDGGCGQQWSMLQHSHSGPTVAVDADVHYAALGHEGEHMAPLPAMFWSPPVVAAPYVHSGSGLHLSAPPRPIFYDVDTGDADAGDWSIELLGAGVDACGLSSPGL